MRVSRHVGTKMTTESVPENKVKPHM